MILNEKSTKRLQTGPLGNWKSSLLYVGMGDSYMGVYINKKFFSTKNLLNYILSTLYICFSFLKNFIEI